MTRSQLEVGELVLVSAGTYSDYRVLLVGRVLKPLTREAYETARAASRAADATPAFDFCDPDQIVAWLLKEGYVAELICEELALGYRGKKWENL